MIKVTGRVNKNEAFDRVELVAMEIVKNPSPEEEIKNLPETPKQDSPKEIKVETLNKHNNENIVDHSTKLNKSKDLLDSKTPKEEIPSLDDIEEISIDDE
jgi:hypothetical protein